MTTGSPSSLLAMHLGHSPFSDEGRFRRVLASSFLLHLLILALLMNLRLATQYDRPLSSYQVSLVSMPQVGTKSVSPPVAQPKKAVKNVSKKIPPVSPPVHQPNPERLSERFAGELQSLVVPHQREKPLSLVEKSPLPADASSNVKETRKGLKELTFPPEAPQLTSVKPLPRTIPAASVVPKNEPITHSLKQAVRSVVVPPISSGMTPEVISPEGGQKPVVQSADKRQDIVLPSQAPPLAAVTPLSKPSREEKQSPQPNKSIVDSLKETIRSVPIPSRRPVTQETPSPHPRPKEPMRTPERTRPVLEKIILPPEVPDLTKLGTEPPSKRKMEVASRELEAELDERIAKLTVPEVEKPEPSRIQESVQATMKRVVSDVQISGIPSGGNPYWGRVREKIDREWVAAPVETHLGEELKVIIAFRLERSGKVSRLTIEQSSGNTYYDLAAKRAILAAEPLPSIPAGLPENYYNLRFQFMVEANMP